jgi:hypothetical protein
MGRFIHNIIYKYFMDIKSTDNTCDLKCAFNFKYQETTIQSYLTTNSIYLRFGSPAIKPVKFNNVEYTPISGTLSYPSTTTYNGIKADGEFTITHIADLHKPLVIHIPVSFSSTTKPLTLDAIVTQTATLLPKTNPTNLTIPSFSLEPYVPKGPFYYGDSSQRDEIYYGLDNSLSLSNETSRKLQEIMVAMQGSSLSSLPDLYYNADGSNLPSEGGSDFNFMECEQYYEEEVPVSSGNEPNIFDKMWRNPTIAMVGAFMLAIFLVGLVLYVFFHSIKALS